MDRRQVLDDRHGDEEEGEEEEEEEEDEGDIEEDEEEDDEAAEKDHNDDEDQGDDEDHGGWELASQLQRSGVRRHIDEPALVCMMLQRMSKTQVCCDLFIAGHMHQYALFISDASCRRTSYASICTYRSFF